MILYRVVSEAELAAYLKGQNIACQAMMICWRNNP